MGKKLTTTTGTPEDLDLRLAAAEAELVRLNTEWKRFGPMAARDGEWNALVTFDPSRMIEKLTAGLAVDFSIIALEALKAERARRALEVVTEPGHRAELEAAVETTARVLAAAEAKATEARMAALRARDAISRADERATELRAEVGRAEREIRGAEGAAQREGAERERLQHLAAAKTALNAA